MDPTEIEARRKLLDDALRQMATERGVEIPAVAPQIGPSNEELLAELSKPAVPDPEFLAAQKADEKSNRWGRLGANLTRGAALVRGENVPDQFEYKPVADAVRKYLERKQAAASDPRRALLMKLYEERVKNPNADVERVLKSQQARHAGTQADKDLAEIPGIRATAAERERSNTRASPELVSYAKSLGIKTTPDMTYKEAKDRIDEALKARGLDIEAEKAKEAKGARGTDEAMKLRKEFQGHKTYQDTQAIASSLERIKTSSGNGPGDIAMIYSFMRLVDPGSTVREGEFATAQNAGGIPGALRATWNKIIGEGRLSPETRAQFLAESEKLFSGQLVRYKRHVDEYRRLAEKSGFDPTDIIGAPEGSAESAPPKADPLGIRK